MCPQQTFGGAHWNRTMGGTTYYAFCLDTTQIGAPFRTCSNDGVWLQLYNRCFSPSLLHCGWSIFNGFDWPPALPDSFGYSPCFGVAGVQVQQRRCNEQGQWEDAQDIGCVPAYTPSDPTTPPDVAEPIFPTTEPVTPPPGPSPTSPGTPGSETPNPTATPPGTNPPCLGNAAIFFRETGVKVPSGAPVHIAPVVQLPPCYDFKDANVRVNYTITPDVPAVRGMLSTGGYTLVLPKGALKFGIFRIDAFLHGRGLSNLTTHMNVQVLEQPPVLVIENRASERQVAIDTPISLNATASYNPNDDSVPVECLWKCKDITQEQPSNACPFERRSGCLQSFEPFAFPPEKTLRFELTVSTASSNLNTTAVVALRTVRTQRAVVSISIPGLPPNGRVVTSQALRLLGRISFVNFTTAEELGPVTMQWTSLAVMGPPAAGGGPPTVQFPALDLKNASIVLGSTDTFNLVIRENVLQPHASYTFRLMVNTTFGGTFAQVDVRTGAVRFYIIYSDADDAPF